MASMYEKAVFTVELAKSWAGVTGPLNLLGMSIAAEETEDECDVDSSASAAKSGLVVLLFTFLSIGYSSSSAIGLMPSSSMPHTGILGVFGSVDDEKLTLFDLVGEENPFIPPMAAKETTC